jgi:hypothetical protein
MIPRRFNGVRDHRFPETPSFKDGVFACRNGYFFFCG